MNYCEKNGKETSIKRWFVHYGFNPFYCASISEEKETILPFSKVYFSYQSAFYAYCTIDSLIFLLKKEIDRTKEFINNNL